MELLILLGILAASPWASSLFTRGRVIPLASVALCLGVVVGPLFFSYQMGLQISLDRLLLLLVLAMCGFRYWNGQFGVPILKRVDIVLAMLVGWLLISALPTSSPPGTLPPLSRWLTFIAIPFAMYCIARLAPLEARDCSALITALIALGIYLGITGFLEVANLHRFVFPRYIVDPTNWEFLGRARGPLLNPTGNGVVLTVSFAAALLRLIHANRLDQIRYGIATAVIGVGIVATLTRSVWIGGMLTVLCVGWIYYRRYLPAIGLCGLAALVLMTTVPLRDNMLDMKRDKHLSAADAAKSVALRPVLAVVAWEMFKDSPLTGHGYGGYFEHSPPYLASRSHEAALESVRPYMQHNIIFSFLVDAGIIAICLFLTWVTLVGSYAWQLAVVPTGSTERRSLGVVMLGCIAGYLFNGMFHDVSVIPMASNFLFFLAGTTVTLHSAESSSRGAESEVQA